MQLQVLKLVVFSVLLCGTFTTRAEAQQMMPLPLKRPAPTENYLYRKPPRAGNQLNGASMTQVSWILSPTPAPEEIKVHDIIMVLVDERSVQQQRRQFQRQRQGSYNVELGEFIRIDEAGNLANAAANQPTVELDYERREQNRGNQNVLESLTYRIAASVTSIRPNGNLIIGARKSIVTNRDAWVYQMTGEVNPKHIDANDTVKSEAIVNLNIIKNSTGKIRDSVKRGWMTRVLDIVSPF